MRPYHIHLQSTASHRENTSNVVEADEDHVEVTEALSEDTGGECKDGEATQSKVCMLVIARV